MIFSAAICFGQNSTSEIKATVTTCIWNSQESATTFMVKTIGYNQIPRYLEYRGVLVQALQWSDATGQNLFVLTETGIFPLNDSNKVINASGSEVFAYLFNRIDTTQSYSLSWKIYDLICCEDSISRASYYPRSLSITDLDGDKTAEISVVYSMSCGNSDKPREKKIIMYEAYDKYEMKGKSLVCFQTSKGPDSIGGIYRADGKLIGQKAFYEFLKRKWNICDGGY